MNILHINTYDGGGAGNAATRLHTALLSSGIESNILFLKESDKPIPNAYGYLSAKEELPHGKEKKDIKHLCVLKDTNGIKGNVDCGILTFPRTSCEDLVCHPLVEKADIIHLHWIARFVDYETFFERIDKPIVWTFHDQNPFNG